MIHNRKELPKNLGVTDLIVFGHSHKYTDQMENGIRWLNPGSCGLKRFYYPITMAVIEVMENGRYITPIRYIPYLSILSEFFYNSIEFSCT